MENQLLQDDRDIQQETPACTKRFVPVEWTKSEWFKIYLQMAREKNQAPDSGNGS
jgi:hypothetical protein